MVPYCIKCGLISNEHLSLWRVVVNEVNRMQERPPTSPGLTCHDVCERLLLVKYLGDSVRHVRGYFGRRGVAHSWLEVREANRRVIIDPYPVAVASGPLLIDTLGLLNPWGALYVEDTATCELATSG